MLFYIILVIILLVEILRSLWKINQNIYIVCIYTYIYILDILYNVLQYILHNTYSYYINIYNIKHIKI